MPKAWSVIESLLNLTEANLKVSGALDFSKNCNLTAPRRLLARASLGKVYKTYLLGAISAARQFGNLQYHCSTLQYVTSSTSTIHTRTCLMHYIALEAVRKRDEFKHFSLNLCRKQYLREESSEPFSMAGDCQYKARLFLLTQKMKWYCLRYNLMCIFLPESQKRDRSSTIW